MISNKYWKRRGFPWEYDVGPAKNLSWARLFSETPNYRQLSKTALGREKFRWHFGPMFYRGRLKKNSVKVLIIGQEGAQDESISHRSFSGGTGSRMQHFLNVIGINYSYLFVNTFVYPIFGQYTNDIKWLAQDPRSPIVKHRHEIFNYILKKNDVDLIVAVGTAAKESVKTWVESRGGTCPDEISDLSLCTGNFLDSKTKIVGVRHPGGARNGAATAAIKQSFQDAIDKIDHWISEDATWLPQDRDATRLLHKPYIYSRAPIPFRDFPFGMNWRIGRGGTSSNRKDSQKSIQLFSKQGKYGNSGDRIHYDSLGSESDEGYSENSGDLPYEPPVFRYKDYDKGPGKTFAKLFMGGSKGLTWPDFESMGVTSDASFGFGQIYRGRPKKATILILADQKSHNDLFTCRALTGDFGQKFQAYLHAIGVDKSYCILRVLPVDTLDIDMKQREYMAGHSQIIKVYNAIVKKIIKRKKTKLILTLGDISDTLINRLDTNGIDIINLQDWQNALPIIQNINYPKDIDNPSFTYNGERLQIPGYDLPYGTLKWQGSSGDRARRAKLLNGQWSSDYYKFTMPRWAFSLKPVPLSRAEEQAIINHP